MKTHKYNPLTLSTVGLAALGLLASACGGIESSAVAYDEDSSFLEGSTPNAIVIQAKELRLDATSELSDTPTFSDLDDEALVVVFSNRPLSCEAPEETIGCASQAGWLFVVPLAAGADLHDPVALQDTGRREVQVHHEGLTSCSVGGGVVYAGAPSEQLTMSASAGAVTAQLAGIGDFEAGSIDGTGTLTDLTYSVNGSYQVTLCSGVPQL